MIKDLLDQTMERVRDEINIRPACEALFIKLREIRLAHDDVHWNEVVKPACNAHPINKIYSEDPHTRRARERPRGYAGDAVMLDQLYFRTPPESATPLGQSIFDCTTSSPTGQGVCWRMEYLAKEIDRASAQFSLARILSLACGHLREAGRSTAVRSGKVGVLYAVDQDDESLAVVRQDYGHLNINVSNGSLRGVLKGKVVFEGLHLAYAAGLYDYLDEPIAQALTAKLFSMLSAGGKVIIPNFLTTNHGRGYMESFMDWHLIVRDQSQIERLGSRVPRHQIAERRYFEDPLGVVGYLEIVKR